MRQAPGSARTILRMAAKRTATWSATQRRSSASSLPETGETTRRGAHASIQRYSVAPTRRTLYTTIPYRGCLRAFAWIVRVEMSQKNGWAPAFVSLFPFPTLPTRRRRLSKVLCLEYPRIRRNATPSTTSETVFASYRAQGRCT